MKKLIGFVVLVLSVLVPVSAAQAAATLTGPLSGATVTTGTPTFTWLLGAGEMSDLIGMSKSSAVGADGAILWDSTLPFASLTATPSLMTYTPTAALYAGTYYWQVRSSAAGSYLYSAPQPFVVPVKLRIPILKVKRKMSATHKVIIAIGTWASVKTVTFKTSVRIGGRQISHTAYTDPNHTAWATDQYTDTIIFPTDTRKGTRVKFILTVTGGGMTVKKSFVFTSP